MNQFINRIASYVANEILIKGLANSKTFQRIAVRTDSHIQNLKRQSNESINSTLDEMHKTATKTAYSTTASSSSRTSSTSGPPLPPPTGISGFFQALGKVIQKDFGGGSK